MSELSAPTSNSDVGAIRVLIGLGGVITLIIGILIVVWPGRTAAVVAGVIAAYALIAGVVYAAIGLFGSGRGGWWRLGHVVLGVLFVVVAILAFSNLRATTAFLATFLGIITGAMWVVSGAGAIAMSRYAPSRGWAIVSGIISIVAGVLLLFSPIFGVAVLWWLLGISAIVIGIAQIIYALSITRAVQV
ncbi:DUF308 domain-containing protein [Actinotalea sp. M2MS4P-6]|uniref:HdeD family acid-resistance protein n=1 Tax=Actinotalea sp. M2MS4P-6 TaxID=2983762 RepID=UPI0021E4861F|nr:DUF308 domain-containing protein [Actinotalea sp. M2MS4P-6]MCV2395595.1 DUF308 domain-containing protein [Actinotalea sp. M2MS4P-6]